MSNKVKDINIKDRTYYFFNDISNIKNFDPDNIKIDEKSYKKFIIYHIGYVTIKDFKYVKINNINHLYLIFSKVNGYFEVINKGKYLTLVHTNERNEEIKKYKELISSITKNSDDYDKKYLKINLNSDDELHPNETIEIPSMTIVARVIFLENNKYYLQVYADEFKKINIKSRTSYCFDDKMKVKDINVDNILLEKKSYQNILVYHILYNKLWMQNHCVLGLIN